MEYPFPQNEGRTVGATGQWYRSEGAEIDRKRLGQYFTSMPLARLLAHLSLGEGTRTVLDPMCGDGNLLAAVGEVAKERQIPLTRLDGIELDQIMARRCASRLAHVSKDVCSRIVTGDAFQADSLNALSVGAYDLVIANPPYVRYQALSRNCENTGSPDAKQVRAELVNSFRSSDGPWSDLAKSYSGFADLSVPAWLLSAFLVRPEGTLALIVPATWRSRDYADILRYLMVTAFELELIVEDTQPGWFSDALVRTNLVIARRRSSLPMGTLQNIELGRSTKWLTIAPIAATADSIVGSEFPGQNPERQLIAWVDARTSGQTKGIHLRSVAQSSEVAWLETHASNRRWYSALEGKMPRGATVPRSLRLPDQLNELICEQKCEFVRLCEINGVSVGQGLRTGCNGFFYVDSVGNSHHVDRELIEPRGLFAGQNFEVPKSALRPVLRRQSELPVYESGAELSGRLLDLRGWVLDEDARCFSDAQLTRCRIIPDMLADHVRRAAVHELVRDDPETKIPLLSAVRTNARSARGESLPRFWYTIPDLVPRHFPDLFVPRVSNLSPKAYLNRVQRLVVDANFSTITVRPDVWTGPALLVLLRSTWAKVCMELLGTQMGGGALKLEATQLKKLPIPAMSKTKIRRLHEIGQQDQIGELDLRKVDQLLLTAIVGDSEAASALERLSALADHLSAVRRRRQK